MSWTIDTDRRPGVLWIALVDSPSAEEMHELVAAHNTAILGYAGEPYTVFCDLRAQKVLSPEAAAVFEEAKAFSSAQPNFLGSAVLVASQVVGMQHRRTSLSGGVGETELIGNEEGPLWAHLDTLLG